MVSCEPGEVSGRYLDGVVGEWSGVSIFNIDGDTIPFTEPVPLIVFGSDGAFRYERPGHVTTHIVLHSCDEEWAVDGTAGTCVEMSEPTAAFDLAPYWDLQVRGDTLIFGTMEDDGWSQLFVR